MACDKTNGTCQSCTPGYTGNFCNNSKWSMYSKLITICTTSKVHKVSLLCKDFYNILLQLNLLAVSLLLHCCHRDTNLNGVMGLLKEYILSFFFCAITYEIVNSAFITWYSYAEFRHQNIKIWFCGSINKYVNVIFLASNTGFYGPNCSYKCSNCIDDTCNRFKKECIYGCAEGYAGKGCDRCIKLIFEFAS